MKLMIKIFLSVLLYLPFNDLAMAFTPSILVDTENVYQTPKAFRIIETNNLHLMGSAQFSVKKFEYVLNNYPKPTYIFDLRQESHGFLNGLAISWYGKNNWENLNKSLVQIIDKENMLLHRLKNQFIEVIYKTKVKKDPMEVHPSLVFNEQQLVEHEHIHYIRIPVADHRRPSDDQVDRFVTIIKSLPPQNYLYFHCRGGKGRTTSFMAMVDMMRNAKKESFETILQRHYRLGGADLFREGKTKQLNYYAQQRLIFLKEFYSYCQKNHDDYKTTWNEWRLRHLH